MKKCQNYTIILLIIQNFPLSESIGILNLLINRKDTVIMNNLTSEEQQRLWKLDKTPIRKILLWGLDSKKNPCLLILYGKHEVERELRSRPRSYYAEAYLLKPTITYTHYTVFHGINGHLPSIPNTYYCEEKNQLCYIKGYRTAHIYWDYNRGTGWHERIEIDEKYLIKEFYEIEKEVTFNYYEKKNYADYVAYLKSNQINFKDFELIENPSDLFGFEADSPYIDLIVNMFSRERVYTRKNILSNSFKCSLL